MIELQCTRNLGEAIAVDLFPATSHIRLARSVILSTHTIRVFVNKRRPWCPHCEGVAGCAE